MEDVPPLLEGADNSQALTVGGAVVALRRGETVRVEAHGVQVPIRVLLHEGSPYPKVGGISED